MISQQFSAYFIVQCNSRLILIFNAIFVDICNDMQFETIFLHPFYVSNAWFIELSRLSIRFYFILRISLRLKDFHVISFIDIILKTFINRYLSNQMVKRERITENTQQSNISKFIWNRSFKTKKKNYWEGSDYKIFYLIILLYVILQCHVDFLFGKKKNIFKMEFVYSCLSIDSNIAFYLINYLNYTLYNEWVKIKTFYRS